MPLRVLLVCKRTSFEAYAAEGADPALQRVLRRGGSIASTIRAAHREHTATVAAVSRALDAAGAHTRRVVGARFPPPAARGPFDLVVSVGGDGTFLEAARLAGSTPILGVNSDPRRSVGRFCGAVRATFARVLRDFLAGRLRAVSLARLHATAGTRAGEALNDLLVAHLSPASTSSYVLALRPRGPRERQRSSGLWISTAAGSTGAIRSAGGRVMPLRSRRVQFLVREAYRGATGRGRPRLRGGLVEPGHWLELECRMTQAVVYFDGGRARWTLRLGDVLRVEVSPTPCNALAVR